MKKSSVLLILFLFIISYCGGSGSSAVRQESPKMLANISENNENAIKQQQAAQKDGKTPEAESDSRKAQGAGDKKPAQESLRSVDDKKESSKLDVKNGGSKPSVKGQEKAAETDSSFAGATGAMKKGKKSKAGKKAAGKSSDGEDEEGDVKESPKEESKTAAKAEKKSPAQSGLKAGFADDNKQFNYFVNFLEKYKEQVESFPISIQERIIIRVKDKDKKSIANAQVTISAGSKEIVSGKTYADGTFLFFPKESNQERQEFNAVITYKDNKEEFKIDRKGKREITVEMDTQRKLDKNLPLDIVFIFDTTGSMGEEIARLKNTIEIINMNIKSFSTKPKVRFGMVLYRDKEEDYVTKVVPLTENLEKFQEELDKVEADGGGDAPEDLQSALKDAMKEIKWNKDGVRMAFIITDAPAHLDYEEQKNYTYREAVKDAQKAGIKIFSIGTGGLDLNGEYVLRQISQYTYAKYIFLTYGEKGESEGGKPGSVSHHTGANFQTDKLETIIIRFAKEELAYLTDQKIEEGEDYFTASKIEDEKKEETLKKLFDMAVVQLIDFSTIAIKSGTSAGVLPVFSSDKNSLADAEYFTEQLIFSVAQNKTFKMVERKDFQKILSELELQSSALFDEEKAPKIGNLLGAKVLLVGKLYAKKDNFEIFLKLVRVETGEILTVTKVKIDKKLGLK